MPKDQDNMKNMKDTAADFNDSGDIDLSKDLEDIELSLNDDLDSASKDTTESFESDDIDELDADLNLEDEIELDDNTDFSDSLDLDSALDLSDSSENELNLEDDNLMLDLELENNDLALNDSEEYGVDLKSDPETIDTFSFESDEVLNTSDDDFKLVDEKDIAEEDFELSALSKEEEDLQGLVSDIESELDEKNEVSLDETISSFSEIDSLPELNDEEIKDEFVEELPDISDEELSLDSDDSLEPTLEDNLESLDLNGVLDEEALTEVDSLELDKVISDDLSDIDIKTDINEISFDEFESDVQSVDEPMELELENESLSSDLPDISADDLTLSLDEISEDELITGDSLPEINNEDLDVCMDELKETISEEYDKLSDIQDISPEELNIDLSESDIESINLTNAKPVEDNDNMDFSSTDQNDLLSSKIEDQTFDNIEDISVDTSDIELQENIFPDDDKLPALDEDITSLDIDGSDDLENGIAALKDSENILSNNLEGLDDIGSLSDIDLDNIPEQISEDMETEEESIGLSLDELENVSKNTSLTEKIIDDNLLEDEKIKDDTLLDELNIEPLDDSTFQTSSEIDDENETIDLATFDADLKEIETSDLEIADDKDIYADLNEEMKGKRVSEAPQSDVESLKNNVKDVLAYLDQLLDALPEEKIKEFAESKAFEKYKKLFSELKIKK